VRAGKRTYFFDVKSTRAGEQYLTITESKRRFNNEQGKFYYEKHKLFLYKEDFDKFANGLNVAIHFIDSGEMPEVAVDKAEESLEKNTEPIKESPEAELDKELDDFGLDNTASELTEKDADNDTF
jgi:uncharacterized protein DUF3276